MTSGSQETNPVFPLGATVQHLLTQCSRRLYNETLVNNENHLYVKIRMTMDSLTQNNRALLGPECYCLPG